MPSAEPLARTPQWDPAALNPNGSSVRPPPSKCYQRIYVSWCIGFWVVMMFGSFHGILIQGPIALYKYIEDASTPPITIIQWIAFFAILFFFGYCEGYKGFQYSFSPLVAIRCFEGAECRSPYFKFFFLDLLLAPLTAAGLLNGTQKRLLRSWALVLMIIILIILVRTFAKEPWRAFIDTGVGLGLGWGLWFLVVWTYRIGCRNVKPDFMGSQFSKRFERENPELFAERDKMMEGMV